MARVKIGFECIDCKELLKIPENSDIVNFLIALLEFYRDHNKCYPDKVASGKDSQISAAKKRVRKQK